MYFDSSRFYSGVVAGAREALICDIPSMAISLNWWTFHPCLFGSLLLYFLSYYYILYTFLWNYLCRKKDESRESDLKDAVSVCLPLITAAIRDIEKENFPKGFFLNVEIPTSPLTNKVFVFQVRFFLCNVSGLPVLCISLYGLLLMFLPTNDHSITFLGSLLWLDGKE